MKKNATLLIALLILSVSMICANSFAQSHDVAASKEKQANLEKIKARQAAMKQKYNAMTPEQQAEAKQKYVELKKGKRGAQKGKPIPAGTEKTVTTNKKAPSAPALQSKNPKSSKAVGISSQKAVKTQAATKGTNPAPKAEQNLPKKANRPSNIK